MTKWDYLIEGDIDRRRKAREQDPDRSQVDIDRETLRHEDHYWEKVNTVRVGLNRGENIRTADVLRPLGVFAVGRAYGGGSNGYSLTHLPTGLRICPILRGKGSKKQLKKLAEAVELQAVNSGVTWLFGSFKQQPGTAVISSIAKVIVIAARRIGIPDETVSTAVGHCDRENISLEDD